ncbi:MAG: hypothetical protein ABSC22_07360 [Roseiarcus sp.]
MSAPIALGFGLFLAGVLLGLAQLWFQVWTPETFLKIAITDGALLAIVLVWNFVVREKRDFDRIRKDDRLR